MCQTLESTSKSMTRWEVAKEFIIDGVYYTHGVNVSGVNSALNLASNMGMSAVMGHLHNQGGIKYQQLPNRTIFGMNVGCLTNDSTLNNNRPYAFDYSKDMRKRKAKYRRKSQGAKNLFDSGCPIRQGEF